MTENYSVRVLPEQDEASPYLLAEIDDGFHKRIVDVPREQADIVDHPDCITIFIKGHQQAISPTVSGFADLMSRLTSF